MDAFNSLYWDFCFASRAWLSIKLFGGFYAFNSLYWDFCFASNWVVRDCVLGLRHFQFPLLGFLLCIVWAQRQGLSSYWAFQFPLLGFLLCIYAALGSSAAGPKPLSIPFIGIFALHPEDVECAREKRVKPFNSLYWDFCFASHLCGV